MYQNGEIQELMAMFEKSLKSIPAYISGSLEKAEMADVELGNGRVSRRYVNNNYYNNGNVNQMFLAYMHGYAYGKAVER